MHWSTTKRTIPWQFWLWFFLTYHMKFCENYNVLTFISLLEIKSVWELFLGYMFFEKLDLYKSFLLLLRWTDFTKKPLNIYSSLNPQISHSINFVTVCKIRKCFPHKITPSCKWLCKTQYSAVLRVVCNQASFELEKNKCDVKKKKKKF